MTKPRLEKVMALFYVLQHAIKRGCAYFDTASFFTLTSRHLQNKDTTVSFCCLIQ